MEEKRILECFHNGIDCSQVVLSSVAPKLGMDEKTALKISAAFGGGMWHGETCGCIVGALMALGLKYGQSELGDKETKNKFLEKKEKFEKEFTKCNKSLICREILGHDLSAPGELEKIISENLLDTICPKLVISACNILEDLL